MTSKRTAVPLERTLPAISALLASRSAWRVVARASVALCFSTPLSAALFFLPPVATSTTAMMAPMTTTAVAPMIHGFFDVPEAGGGGGGYAGGWVPHCGAVPAG